MKLSRRQIYLAFGGIALAGLVPTRGSAEEMMVSTLAKQTHFHGIAIHGRDASRLYLATHHGFYVVTPDGKATRASETRDDFMGFTPHPTNDGILYASGHPAGGGNLGFMSSTDGGRSWTKLSDGAGARVDFHQMDVSKFDPKTIYGSYGDLQRSADGGRTWNRLGPAPEGLISLAASARSADTIYAATQLGLILSRDGGRRWMPAHGSRQPATMVRTTMDATIYAFIAGTGLVRASESDLDWQVVSNGFGRGLVQHLAGPATSERTLYAVIFDPDTRGQSLRISRDGGKNWVLLG